MHPKVKKIQALKEAIQETDKQIFAYRFQYAEELAEFREVIAVLSEGEFDNETEEIKFDMIAQITNDNISNLENIINQFEIKRELLLAELEEA